MPPTPLPTAPGDRLIVWESAHREPPEARLEDGDVVRAVLAGEVEAYAILVRRYQDLLYRYAERMTGRPDEAADIVQAALIKGFRGLRLCRRPERVGAWLFRITANACKDHLKSRRRRDLGLEDVPELASDRGQPGRALERRELADVIGSALKALPFEQREAFVLKHIEGRSYEEIADLLEASVPALKMRVHRARERLQELLEAYRWGPTER